MRRIGYVLLLAGLVFGAACKKDKGGAGGGAGKGKTVGAATSALDVLPEDTAMILGISVEKVTQSKLWTQFSPMFMDQAEVKDGLSKLKDGCGMDPIKDVKSIVIGMNGDMDEKKMVVLIQGNFDEGKITKCVTTLAEKEAGGKKVTAKTEGKITTFSAEGESTQIYVGWAGKDTIVITQSAVEGDKTFLASVLEGKSSAKNNKDLAALMGNVDTSNTLWAAMQVTGKLKSNMAASDGPQPVAVWMNIDYSKALKAEIGAHFANDKDASSAVDKAKKEIDSAKSDPTAGPYLKNLTINAKGSDAIVSISLDEKQVDELVAQLQQLLPLLMMGAMGGGGMGGGM
jgi:hypothetical protein